MERCCEFRSGISTARIYPKWLFSLMLKQAGIDRETFERLARARGRRGEMRAAELRGTRAAARRLVSPSTKFVINAQVTRELDRLPKVLDMHLFGLAKVRNSAGYGK